MKAIYENPELIVLGTTVQDVITASGDPPKKVTNFGAQTGAEGGVGFDSIQWH